MANKCPSCHSDNPDTPKFCGECGTQLPPRQDHPPVMTETLQTPVRELTTGTTFAGRYQIIEELGHGGMGKVYRALDKKLNEEVALKLIKPEIALDKSTLERFQNELKVARKISHRNVGRMYELMEDRGLHFITMEYVPGEDLRSFLHRSKQLSIGTAVAIAKDISGGLAEAHRLGVVHRDLKPSNIIIDKDGNARIMDFGIARSLKAKGITGAGVMIGTPEYMSPEQVEGKEIDQRSDIYSLGIILYEMLTGRVPFEGDTPFTIGVKHKGEIPRNPRDLNTQIPPDLGRLVLKCLEKDKAKRYQSTEELRTDLERIEQGLPTTERVVAKRKPFTSREITVKFNLRKLVLPALIIVLIVAAAVFLWQLFSNRTPAPSARIDNSIAVISFENLTGDSQYDSLIKAVPNLFITKFEAMGFSYVATWERLRDILKQLGKDPEKPIDTETGLVICRQGGIAALVVGKLTKAGNVFATDIKVLDVETKKSLTSATAQGKGEDSILLSQIDELSGHIARKFGGKTQSTEGVPAVSEITTSSMAAYESYLKGNEAYEKASYEEARQYFIKAVEIEPAFVMAHLGVAHAYYQQGNIVARDKAMEKVMAHADRANPKEKLYIQAWHARYIERDRDKTALLLRGIIEKYPKEKEARYWMGLHLLEKDPDQAIREFQTVLELDPHYSTALGEISYIYMLRGDLENALDYAKRFAAEAPNDPFPLGDAQAIVYMKMGQLDLAIEKCREALSLKPDFNHALGNIVNSYGLKENYSEALKWAGEKVIRSKAPLDKADGYLLKAFYEFWTGAFQKAHDDAGEARKLGEAIQNQDAPYWSCLLEAYAYLARGNFDLAGNSFIQGLDVYKKTYPENPSAYELARQFFLGLTEVKQKKTEAGRERLETISRMLAKEKDPAVREYFARLSSFLRGEILLAEGSYDDAISIFQKLPELIIRGPGWVSTQGREAVSRNLIQPEAALARGHEMKGDIDKAVDVLERLIRFDPDRKFSRQTPPNQYALGRRLTPPKAYYDLGRLYEKKGMKEKARKNYRRFLDLWNDADAGLPEAEDALKRLTGLKAQ